MVTMTGQKKRSLSALILLALLVVLVSPAYAGVLRYEFENRLSPWKIHQMCGGIGVGSWSVDVEDGLVKVKDGGCGIGSRTGIYHPNAWADYEVYTRIQLWRLGGFGVELVVRAEKSHPSHFGFQGSRYRIWRDNPLDTGKWYDVRILIEGDRVRYYFDGKKVSDETTSRKSGGIAFIAELSEFWVDYVAIILPIQPHGSLIACWAELKS